MTTPAALTVNVDEACGIVGVSRRYLYRKIRAGEIKTCLIGTRRRVLVSSLKQFVLQHVVAADATSTKVAGAGMAAGRGAHPARARRAGAARA